MNYVNFHSLSKLSKFYSTFTFSSLQESRRFHPHADHVALKDGSRDSYSYWNKNLLFTFIGPLQITVCPRTAI